MTTKENLLISLIKGLEDIKSGKIKPWKKFIEFQK